jgi:hypothetical protein
MVMMPVTRSKSKQVSAKAVDPDVAKRVAKAANGVSLVMFFVILIVAGGVAGILGATTGIADGWLVLIICAGLLLAFYLLFAFKIADQWEKAVVLRFGRFTGLKGPGQFWIVHREHRAPLDRPPSNGHAL